SGLSIHDISRPPEMKEIAFLEMQGFGINRLWWPGGRYAYVAAHFDGFTDHILCIVDLKDITKPEIVSRWWLPGMNRQAGETSTPPRLQPHCRPPRRGTSVRSALSVRTTCTRTVPAAFAARTPSLRHITMRECACLISKTRSPQRKSPIGFRLRRGSSSTHA